MTTNPDTKRIAPSRCDSCGATVDHVEVVCTLAARGQGLSPEHAEPAEYGDRCAQCGQITSFSEIGDTR